MWLLHSSTLSRHFLLFLPSKLKALLQHRDSNTRWDGSSWSPGPISYYSSVVRASQLFQRCKNGTPEGLLPLTHASKFGKERRKLSKWPASFTGINAQWPSVQSGSQGHVCPKSPHPGFVLLNSQAALNYHINYQGVRIWSLLLNFSLLKFHPSYLIWTGRHLLIEDIKHCVQIKTNNFTGPQNKQSWNPRAHLYQYLVSNSPDHSKIKAAKW